MEVDQLELKTVEYTDRNTQDLEYDIDPENNFLTFISSNCCYYTEEQHNQNIRSEGKLSIIHVNSRSVYANFDNINEYLCQFDNKAYHNISDLDH